MPTYLPNSLDLEVNLMEWSGGVSEEGKFDASTLQNDFVSNQNLELSKFLPSLFFGVSTAL